MSRGKTHILKRFVARTLCGKGAGSHRRGTRAGMPKIAKPASAPTCKICARINLAR